MFWGISLESGKRYSQTVEKSFHISMAALNSPSSLNDKSSVTIMVEVEKACYPLCTLISGQIPQQTLDYFFTEGEEVLFYTEGDQLEVHLTGYLADDPDPVEYSSSENESEEESTSSDVSVEEKESMENLLAEIDGLNEDNDGDINMWLPRAARVKNKQSEAGPSCEQLMIDQDESDESEDTEWQPGNKKRKKDNIKNDNEKDMPKKDDQSFSKSKKKRENDKLKQNGETFDISQEEKSPVENDKKDLKSSQKEDHHEKRHLSGGVLSEDLVKGTGKKAKKGKHVSVYYKGMLKKTKRVFDQCVDGEPFKFKLGDGDVIPGWETGVEGMHVGGKRRLTIPPSQAYGSKEMGSIPANSTLVFIVELMKVA